VFFLDLDAFKVVNDSLGHEIGDILLVSVAERLGRCLRPEDTLARFGGDELVVLVEDVEVPDEALRVTERITNELIALCNDIGPMLLPQLGGVCRAFRSLRRYA
jgi:diguanylate cyclase (GGDEF)-like protein